ncbi:MAG: LysR substrate-binding domain-containing protein, partial [Sphingomonadales bacterium]
AALETRYDTKLFDRTGRRITLTDTGRLFLEEAKAVSARASAAELMLADLAGLKRGELRVAASQTVGNYWLPQFIYSFRQKFPGVVVSLTIGNTATVTASMRDGAVNLGFVEGEIETAGLSVMPVADDEMILVAPAGHPWGGRRRSRKLDLGAAAWIVREAGSGTRAVLDGFLARNNHSAGNLAHALVLPTNESVLTAVEAGFGVTVISKMAALAALRAKTIVRVGCRIPPRRFYMLRHVGRYVTSVEREFVHLVQPS